MKIQSSTIPRRYTNIEKATNKRKRKLQRYAKSSEDLITAESCIIDDEWVRNRVYSFGTNKGATVHLLGEFVRRLWIGKRTPESGAANVRWNWRGRKAKRKRRWLKSGQKSKRPDPGVYCASLNRPWNPCCAFFVKFLFTWLFNGQQADLAFSRDV